MSMRDRRERRTVRPSVETLDGRQLMSICALNPDGSLTPIPLATAAEQQAGEAIMEVVEAQAAPGSPWWSHLNPLDPQFIPNILTSVGLPDPFGPTAVVTPPPGQPGGPPWTPVTIVPGRPMPGGGSVTSAPFPWIVAGPPPIGYNPQTGQIDPVDEATNDQDVIIQPAVPN